MSKRWMLCVLLGTLAWGQAAPAALPPTQPGVAARPAAPVDTSAAIPPGAPVITVIGVCPAKPKAAAPGSAAKPAAAAKTPAASAPADCKTVITKAEFEKLASALAPNLTPQLRKQLAGVLPGLIAMSDEAKKKGLDKTPRFEEQVKFTKMQILKRELQQNIQEEAAKVSPAEIAGYYKQNPEAYEQFAVERIFVPRAKQPDSEKIEDDDQKGAKPTEEQQKAKQAEEKAKQAASELEMTKLADSLRSRAAAGEAFAKLQKEAFDAAGMRVESPTVLLPKVRRTGLPPAHAAVFELKAGEVSQVINDTGGHYIYKVDSREQLPIDQVKDEIHNVLQNQRTRDMMDKVNSSFKVETNEAYFGGGADAAMPHPPRMPNPRMAPAPTTPAAKPQTPPESQTPVQSPDAKPN